MVLVLDLADRTHGSAVVPAAVERTRSLVLVHLLEVLQLLISVAHRVLVVVRFSVASFDKLTRLIMQGLAARLLGHAHIFRSLEQGLCFVIANLRGQFGMIVSSDDAFVERLERSHRRISFFKLESQS